MAAGKIDCIQCEHFVITWDPRFPRACRLYGFRSRQFPSVEVVKATGEECIGFAQKKREKPQEDK